MIFWNEVLISNLQYGDDDLSKTGVILNVNRDYLLSRTHRDGGRICRFLMGGERLTIFVFISNGRISFKHSYFISKWMFSQRNYQKKTWNSCGYPFFLNICIINKEEKTGKLKTTV